MPAVPIQSIHFCNKNILGRGGTPLDPIVKLTQTRMKTKPIRVDRLVAQNCLSAPPLGTNLQTLQQNGYAYL